MLTLYGIPNCDTVKKARNWLDAQNIDYRFHDFRKDGLSTEQLQALVQQSDWETLLNRKSTSWRGIPDAEKQAIHQDSALVLMLQNPTLIKRPVLDTGRKILIGFDAEQYQKELCVAL